MEQKAPPVAHRVLVLVNQIFMRSHLVSFLALILFAEAIHAQSTTYLDTFPKGDGRNRPVPKELQGLPHCVTVNNDDATIKPMVFHDDITGNYFYVESDGRHITAFAPDGKILWHRNPFVDAHLQPYRCTKPIIKWIGRDQYRQHKLAIAFNSSQAGTLDDKTGDFQFAGQD